MAPPLSPLSDAEYAKYTEEVCDRIANAAAKEPRLTGKRVLGLKLLGRIESRIESRTPFEWDSTGYGLGYRTLLEWDRYGLGHLIRHLIPVSYSHLIRLAFLDYSLKKRPAPYSDPLFS